MNDALVLSLGHNSSAVLIRDNRILAGYETERLSGVKSDSSFPKLPILELQKRFKLRDKVDFYVSHWELFGEAKLMKPKHWDPTLVHQIANGGHVFETNPMFTHHDAHAWSAVSFAGQFPKTPQDNTYVFVMDGFGTFGEHMSFYRYVDGVPILLERKFGFRSSLGLLYQYTTAFLGMKMNQDEYKLLAFEAHIDEYPEMIDRIDVLAETWVQFYIKSVSAYMEPDVTDPLLDVGALPHVAQAVSEMLEGICKALDIQDERARRVVCSYVAQKITEEVVMMFLHKYQPTNIILAGGLFYNVKVNSMVARNVPGKTCIMPLAGDQGAGLGVYSSINPDFRWPEHLFWGIRDLDRGFFDSKEMEDIGIHYFENEDDGFAMVRDQLEEHGLVNLVRGNMEYGPRALCNTTTLGLPDKLTANCINDMNDRTNEMPFAPVVTAEQASYVFEDCDKVHRSLEYMVCTRDYSGKWAHTVPGAAHKYPRQDKFSGRPQITSDPSMVKLLGEYGPLINTSFNYHGVPIPCTDTQIRYSHVMERQRSKYDNVPVTVVIGGSES